METNRKLKTISRNLPQEIVEEILSKLPIKYHLRFSTVSKEWYSIITTPRLKPLSNQTLFLLYFSYYSRNDRAICVNNDVTIQEYANLVWNEGVEDEKHINYNDFDCWANGLICFSDDEDRVSLWNPSIRRTLLLPKSNVESVNDERFAFGVVVDHISNDYKILRAIYVKNAIKFEIFKLSTGSWKVLDFKGQIQYLDRYQVDLKGKSYWIAVDFEFNLLLVSFDEHTELFDSVKIYVPWVVSSAYFWIDCGRYLFLFNESMVLIHSILDEDDSNEDRGGNNGHHSFKVSMVRIHSIVDPQWGYFTPEVYKYTYKIWKMEDTEGKSLTLWCTIAFDELVRPLGFRENGECLWLVGRTILISTNLENGSHTCLGSDRANAIRSCSNYVESLALWKGPKFQQISELRRSLKKCTRE